MTDGNTRRESIRRKLTTRSWIVAGVLASITGLAIGIPELLLARATARAKECLAQYPQPRGPEALSCGLTIQPFIFPAKVPWTAHRARYRAEELTVRIAHNDYLDAAVGKPDSQALAHAAEAVDHQAAVVQNGSTRVGFSELGPSIGAPDPGRDADEIGDRRTLLERGDQWFNWRIRLSTLRAAFLSGDVPKAEALAKRYAVDDPRDPDIRSAVAAVLCMGTDTEKGMSFLAFIQDDRSSRRYEALARDYGDVRAMLVACSAKAGKSPPPAPSKSDAGSADAIEQRALLRLRLAQAGGAESPKSAAIAAAINLLEGGPRNPGARVALLAAVLAAGAKLDTADVVRLSKPRYDEAAFASPIALTAIDWLSERRALGDVEHPPIVPAKTFVQAVNALDALVAEHESASESEDKPTETNESDKEKASRLKDLAQIRAALLLEGAMSFAREGVADEALSCVDGVIKSLELAEHARGLLRSNVLWLTGDREKALTELVVDATAPLHEPVPYQRLLATAHMQRAELAMSLGKLDQAKKDAQSAASLAESANDPYLVARISWILAALGAIEPKQLSTDKLLSGTAFSSMGFGDPTQPWLELDPKRRQTMIQQALSPWIVLAKADSTVRRAGRWAALDARGDAPPWLPVHFLLASRLLGPGEGDPEVWLDALFALDDRRFSLRQIAFARAQAAHMRGDATVAATWETRYRVLAKLAADPLLLELTRHVDI